MSLCPSRSPTSPDVQKRRIGHKKAAVAVGHSILIICWHLHTNNCDYDDLGGDWFMRRTDNDKRRDFLIRQL